MNCMRCGSVVKYTDICPVCGCDLSVQKKALQLSCVYYNMGLDKAQIRDLSGAIDMLRRSLKFNKLNIDARNLLGLVYYEVGEVVSALSEWVLSKNIQPEENIASDYINRMQQDSVWLDDVNKSIRKYNFALQCCRNGNDDVAVIQLKKALAQNPRLIKAYHLLSLIEIHREEYESARSLLRKAARIDKTNATTLRFLREIDEQTGTITWLEERKGLFRRKQEQTYSDAEEMESVYLTDSKRVIQPAVFRESPAFGGVLNILVGVLIGALVVGFLTIPSVKLNASRAADEKVAAYSTTVATQSNEIQHLTSEIDTSNETVESAQAQIDDAGKKAESYENLVKAYAYYQNQTYDTAWNALQNVDESLLSVDGKAMYNSMSEVVKNEMFNKYWTDGKNAFDQGNYPVAAENLEKAYEINNTDYNILLYLAHSYRLSSQVDKAITIFQRIIETNPDTRRASAAEQYIARLQAGDIGEGEDIVTGDETPTPEPEEEASEEEKAAAEAQAQAEQQAAAEAQAQAEQQAAAEAQAEQQAAEEAQGEE